MNLADEILAARGDRIQDFGGAVSSISKGIEQAERFVLSDEVIIAAYRLIQSKPASLFDAMPLCRLPYRNIWLEWRGGQATQAGWAQYPSMAGLDRSVARPEPLRMGCLIEGGDKSGQRGSMTWAWVHKESGVCVCGVGVNFDWSKDGNIAAWTRGQVKDDPHTLGGMLLRRWVDTPKDDASIIDLMNRRKGWEKLTKERRQIEAVRSLLHHEAPWLSRHGLGLMKILLENQPDNLGKMLNAWEGDISGECPVVGAVILMLNSRNAVEREPVDLGKLNKARAKRGKGPLLSHTVTRLYLSKNRARAGASAGYSREAMRQHMVMGHFKIRKTGCYWWSPFLRGDPTRPMHRKQYDVEAPAQ